MPTRELTQGQRCYFRDQLREGRAVALKDAEDFHPIVTALERLGSVLHPKGRGLGDYKEGLLKIAQKGSSAPVDGDDRNLVMPLATLYTSVQNGRNDALHQGAYARHLTRHCIELAIFIEDGLMAEMDRVSDFMVRDPSVAELWQPLAFARQKMLSNSFSFLPIRVDTEWMFLSDYQVARYLSQAADRSVIRTRIDEAYEHCPGILKVANCVPGDRLVADVLRDFDGDPVLVVRGEELLGIATPFDFL